MQYQEDREAREPGPGEMTIFDLYLEFFEVLLTKDEDYIEEVAVLLDADEVDGNVINGISDCLQSASVDQKLLVTLANELLTDRYDLVDDYIVRRRQSEAA